MSALRAIVHCDLDCFYAQVERERLGLPPDAELAVLQWDSALAVSYPARKHGIKRGSSLADIRRLAGDAVTVVHVQTISASDAAAAAGPAGDDGECDGDDKEDEKKEDDPDNDNEPNADADVNIDGRDMNKRRDSQKVSLARYRAASARVFAALNAALRGLQATLERASIDEAFIDVTQAADARLRQAGGHASAALPSTITIAGGDLSQLGAVDARLTHAAAIASELRAAVHAATNFTISAGVAPNKLLAKLCSARHKPDGLSLVPRACVPALLSCVKLRSLRGLGGKLGARVEALLPVHATSGASPAKPGDPPSEPTAADAAALGRAVLVHALGEQQGGFVYDSARGVDESAVVTRGPPKSLLAAKSFAATRDLGHVEAKWLPVLAGELARRLRDDADEHGRVARTLTVSFRATPLAAAGGRRAPSSAGSMANASRSGAMPSSAYGPRGADALRDAATSALRHVFGAARPDWAVPISFLGLTAGKLVARAGDGDGIARFFAKGEKANDGAGPSAGACEDADERHRRRVQERADRELALRLHRQEALGVGSGSGVGKAKTKANGKAKGRGKASKGTDQVRTLDKFFSKSASSRRA